MAHFLWNTGLFSFQHLFEDFAWAPLVPQYLEPMRLGPQPLGSRHRWSADSPLRWACRHPKADTSFLLKNVPDVKLPKGLPLAQQKKQRSVWYLYWHVVSFCFHGDANWPLENDELGSLGDLAGDLLTVVVAELQSERCSEMKSDGRFVVSSRAEGH